MFIFYYIEYVYSAFFLQSRKYVGVIFEINMSTEILVYTEPQTISTEFVTPFQAYQQYKERGGVLSARYWLLAQNEPNEYKALLAVPPLHLADPISRYTMFGGNINPDIFVQANPLSFAVSSDYIAHPENTDAINDMRAAFCQYAPISEKSLHIMAELHQKGMYPPEEIRFLYYQIDSLEPTLPGIGQEGQINIELGQIDHIQKLMDSSRMVAALTNNSYFLDYARRLADGMALAPELSPWMLSDQHLQREIDIMRAKDISQ